MRINFWFLVSARFDVTSLLVFVAKLPFQMNHWSVMPLASPKCGAHGVTALFILHLNNELLGRAEPRERPNASPCLV